MVKKENTKTKQLKSEILKATKGLISNVGNFLLWQIALLEELGPTHGEEFSTGRKTKELALRVDGIDANEYYKTLRNSFYNARRKGWIKENKKLTKEGKERLRGIIPTRHQPKKWDGNWYLVVFDVPEQNRMIRDAFRERLKTLGFGQLQRSVWISPYNFLANVQDIIERYHLFSQAILSQTDKLGQEDSRSLANKVWKLDRINDDYKEFISRYRNRSPKEVYSFKVRIDYLHVLGRDPQLPQQLLPLDWTGEEAYKLYQRFTRPIHC